jgi:hypothetical protein
LTSTWPPAGLGSGKVSTTISPFLKMAARMGILRLAIVRLVHVPSPNEGVQVIT